LFSITRVSVSKNKSIGKSVGMLLMFSYKKFLVALIPILESMFVYIDTASAEKSMACSGMCREARSEIISKEFFCVRFN